MTEPFFRTIHSVLDAGAVAHEVDRRFALDGAAYCELLHRGMNDVYLVRTPGGRFALRAWRAGWRSIDNVAYELDFLNFLKQRGLPVAAPIPATDKSLYFTVRAPEGARAMALFEWAPGRKFGVSPSPAKAFEMGAIFGRIHEASGDFKPRLPRQTNTVSSMRDHAPYLIRFMQDRPDDVDYYTRLMDRLAAALEAVNPAVVPRGPNHGDFHFNNAHVDDEGRITILDFDNSGEDFFLQDVMCYVWANGYAGLDQVHADRFLEGYGSVRPMSADEKALMPLFLLAKEFRLLAGAAAHVNAVGRLGLRFRDLDWFAQSIRAHAADAGLA